MKPLDVTASVDYGYRLIWVERHYLMRLAVVPMVIKFICLLTILSTGWDQQYLRATLVMLPSFFADGWMLSHLVRLVFLGQRWPFRPTGDAVKDDANLNDRAHGVSAGTLFFVVIQYLLAGVNAVMLTILSGMKAEMAANAGQTAHEPSALAGFAALLFLAFSIWSVRLLFLYIPAAVGMRVRTIVNGPQNTLLSLQMLGVALISAIPLMLLANGAANAFIPDGMKPADFTTTMRIVLVAWQVVINTVTYMITTASIAFGIKLMMEARKKA